MVRGNDSKVESNIIAHSFWKWFYLVAIHLINKCNNEMSFVNYSLHVFYIPSLFTNFCIAQHFLGTHSHNLREFIWASINKCFLRAK